MKIKRYITALAALFAVISSISCQNDSKNKESLATTTLQETTITTTSTSEEQEEIRDNFEFSEEIDSGTISDAIEWKIDEYGLLIISGAGNMSDFAAHNEVPWFEHSDSIQYVVLSGDISSIGASSFCNCENLKEIRIDAAISKIGNYAFQNCKSLSEVTIDNDVTQIGIGAFENCYSLESVNLGKTETIGKTAFKDCISLKASPILNNVTRIEDFTFSGCKTMKTAEISENTEYIGTGAFEECESLSSINIPQNLTSISEAAFAGSGIKNLILETQVSDIGISAFSGCEKLESVEFSEGLLNISMAAFSGCTALSEITIPSSVEYIDSNVFAHCNSLKSIEVDENNGYYESLDGVLYTESIHTLKQYPLGKGETEFELPASVTAIEPGALYGKSSLESVTVESGGWSYTANNGVLYSGLFEEIVYYPYSKTDEAFGAPPEVITVDIYAFYGNQYLKTVNFGGYISKIGGGAFENCTNLEEVNLPDAVKEIGKNAFSGTNLQGEFYFYEDVKYYDNSFPENCTIWIMQNETE